MSISDREPPGWPEPASTRILMIWTRSSLESCFSDPMSAAVAVPGTRFLLVKLCRGKVYPPYQGVSVLRRRPPLPFEVRADESVDVAVEHRIDVRRLVVSPHVFHHLVWREDVGA